MIATKGPELSESNIINIQESYNLAIQQPNMNHEDAGQGHPHTYEE